MDIPGGADEEYRFDVYRLWPARGLLCRGDLPVKLPYRRLSILTVLVRALGRIVSKDEIYRAVWGKQIVGEQNLTVHISALRDLLGLDLIATFPGRGYKLMAEVTALRAASAMPEKPAALKPECLAPLSSEPAGQSAEADRGPAGELKLVTLLRAELVGVVGLVAGLGPEQVRARLGRPLEAMRSAIRRFGGMVINEPGDGLLAAFGAPLAQENHATLACHAALDMIGRVADLSEARLRLRIGLHSGTVVSAAKRSDGPPECGLDGSAIFLVERVLRSAQPDRVLATKECKRLADDYMTFETAASLPLDDVADPVPIYRVTGIAGLSSWRLRAARVATRFVGRDAEIAALSQLAESSSNRCGRAVCLFGEPGVGKSRLAHEFVGNLQESGWRLVEVACTAISQSSPYAAVKELLTGILQCLTPDAMTAAAKIEDPALGLPPIWKSALRAVLDMSIADDAWDKLEPRLRGHAIGDACRAVIEATVQQERIVLLIEDLHWIDKASEPVLETLIALGTRHPVLILLTSRPNAALQGLDHPHLTRLSVRPLDENAGTALLESLLGDGADLAKLKRRIFRHTGGVPLFIEEVCRQLIETQGPSDAWHKATLTRSLDDLGVPPTVHGVIAARIDQLGGPERETLQLAAVIGSRFTVGLLQDAARLPADQLKDRLRVLDRVGLLVETRLLPTHLCAFAHDLVRQVAYESIIEPTRIRLHKLILDALEAASMDQGDDQSWLLCHHAVGAKEWQKGYSNAHAIAQKCSARSAFADAAQYFDIALDALDRLPHSTGRERLAIDLRLEARTAFSALGRLDRCRDLAAEAEDRAKAIGDDLRRIAAMGVRAATLAFSGPPVEAVAVSRQVRLQAERLNDLGWLCFAEYTLGQAFYVAGRCREAEQLLGDVYTRLTLPEPQAPAGANIQTFTIFCCMMKSVCHAILGELDPADVFAGRAQDLAARTDRPYDRVAAAYATGVLLLCRGFPVDAQACLEPALSLAREHEFRLFSPLVACQLGIACLEQGLIAKACETLQEAKAAAEIMGHTSVVLRAAVYLGMAVSHGGQRIAALNTVRAARDAARQQGFESLEAEALFSEATILAAGSASPVEIIDLLSRSAKIFESVEARMHLKKVSILLDRTVNLSFA